MQKLNFQFQEYKLSEKDKGFIDPPMMFIAELFGLPCYREDVNFSLMLEEPELLLDRKSEFYVSGSVIAGRENLTEFKIKRWTYGIDKKKEPEVTVYLDEVKPPPIERFFAGLSEDNKKFTVYFTIALVALIILFAFIAIWDYPSPLIFWDFIGTHIRWLIALMLFITTSVFVVWFYTKNKKSTLAREFIGAIGGVLIFAIPIAWGLVSVPPQIGNEFEPIAYLDFLRSRFLSYILLLAGIVPWITIFLKYFGWDLAVSILSQSTKKEKSP